MPTPTFTTHLIRSIHRDLGSSTRLDNIGSGDIPFPSIDGNKDFASQYLLYNVGRKRDVYEKDAVPTEVLKASLGKWTDAEYSCKVVNDHLRYYTPIGDDVTLFEAITHRCKVILSDMLCDVWPDYAKHADYTGGATNHLPRQYSLSAAKWIGYARPGRNQSVVPRAMDHLRSILSSNQAYARRLYRKRWRLASEDLCPKDDYVDWAIEAFSTEDSIAVLDYVPKDTKSVRLIQKTGEGTMLCQAVFGQALRIRLAEKGVDLSDQTINREWAEIGSHTGVVATVDLSSASDTISIGLVRELLPNRWFQWLDDCRDTHVRVKNTTYQLQKFCSMGNGFCFELESMLFYSMAKAVCEVLSLETSFVSIYGDDIIVPSEACDTLEKYFLHWGLFVNHEKSYWGPQGFRESCGGHYYKGKDVTPFYIKQEVESLGDLFHIYNQMCEWSYRTGYNLPTACEMVLNRIPVKDRVLVPPSFGTRTGLHYAVDGAQVPTKKWSEAFQRYITTFRYRATVGSDVSQRWCDRTKLMRWFEQSSCRSVVFEGWFPLNKEYPWLHGAIRLYENPPVVIHSSDTSEKWRTARE